MKWQTRHRHRDTVRFAWLPAMADDGHTYWLELVRVHEVWTGVPFGWMETSVLGAP